MPVTFFIPGPLRSFAAGKSQIVVEQSPTTLADALEALWKLHPGIRDRVATEQAQIREHINIFVGTENVRYTGGLQTPLRDGSEITIIPAISGGCTFKIRHAADRALLRHPTLRQQMSQAALTHGPFLAATEIPVAID